MGRAIRAKEAVEAGCGIPDELTGIEIGRAFRDDYGTPAGTGMEAMKGKGGRRITRDCLEVLTGSG